MRVLAEVNSGLQSNVQVGQFLTLPVLRKRRTGTAVAFLPSCVVSVRKPTPYCVTGRRGSRVRLTQVLRIKGGAGSPATRLKDYPSHMRRFFLIFLGLQLLFFAVELLRPVQQHVILPWTTLLAKVCLGLVTLFDASAAAMGKVLWNPATGFGVSIEPGCNGVEACMILFAAILAFPATLRHKLWGLVLGFVAVQGLNIVRVISLFYLGQWNDTAFRVFHEYLWQGLIMVDVLVVWLVWVRYNPEGLGRDRTTPIPA